MADPASYFKSEGHMYVFLLTRVSGKDRNKILGLTSAEYSSKRAAKRWYKRIALKIHPDKNPNLPDTKLAFTKLKDLYSVLTMGID